MYTHTYTLLVTGGSCSGQSEFPAGAGGGWGGREVDFDDSNSNN